MPSIGELARYPFMGTAIRKVEDLDFKVDELTSPEFTSLIGRAKERIEHAILYAEVQGWALRDEVELLSFPAAVFLVSCLKDERLARRYALAEAKRAYRYLRDDSAAIIKDVAEEFSWKIENVKEHPPSFGIHFTKYLSNSVWIKEAKWRIVNRRLKRGLVLLTKEEIARLLQEEIRLRIECKIKRNVPLLPKKLKTILDDLKRLYDETLNIKPASIIAKETIFAALPPCIKSLYRNLISGKNLSHVGRFTLTSFLLSLGNSLEEVLELFKRSADFDPKMTHYQVEHISGLRGSGRRYTPPKCGTLKTHGLCHNPDELCDRVRHPLNYYKWRARTINQGENVEIRG